MSTIHYLSGLPRSGNTVLSAILNQNPDFYSSPLSPLNDMMWNLITGYEGSEAIIRNHNQERVESLLKGMFQNYYADVKEPIIFDRHKLWTTPGNMKLFKNVLNPNVKIIVTVRDTLEILASFVNQMQDNPELYLEMERNGYAPANHLPLNDAICDYLMGYSGGMLPLARNAIATALLEENKDFIHIVDYKDLVDNPELTMKGIYNFLGVDEYKHDFNNIVKIEEDNDGAIGNIPDRHKVRLKLSNESKKVEELLSQRSITKYSNEDFWKTKGTK